MSKSSTYGMTGLVVSVDRPRKAWYITVAIPGGSFVRLPVKINSNFHYRVSTALVDHRVKFDLDATGRIVAGEVADFVITFGQKYRHEPHPVLGRMHRLPDGFVLIDADNRAQALERAFRVIGQQFAFLYEQNELTPSYFPQGLLAVVRADDSIEILPGVKDPDEV